MKNKTIILGDTHGRSLWKLIVNIEKPDRVIFIGDYFDSFDIKGADQISNFQDIIAYKESNQSEVILLIGNHDYHYFPEIGNSGISGYQHLLAPSIQYIVDENRKHLQMAYQMDDMIFTHAGVSSDFMNGVFGEGGWNADNIVELLNEQWKYKPRTFDFDIAPIVKTQQNVKMSYRDPYGDNVDQSPIWIRPRSLMRANKDTLRKKIIQVVGHTSQTQIDKQGSATGGRYWFIDTLDTSGEYLVFEDGKLSVNTWMNK
jgi:predicted phosphodiesterase